MAVNFEFPPFQPHPSLRHRHAQTMFGTLFPRRFATAIAWRQAAESREFTMADGDRLQAVLHRHPDDPQLRRPLLLLLSGLEGHVDTHYMQGMSTKAFAAGYHSLRLNYRTCGGTEHLARRLYNGGMIEDIDTVIRQLGKEADWRIVLAGVSLGANKLLRLLGTYGETPPAHLLGGMAISPPIELAVAGQALSQGFNRVYDRFFLQSMKRRLRRMLAQPSLRPEDQVHYRRGLAAQNLLVFDDVLTGPSGGYGNAADYYRTASTGDLVGAIRVPTLLIHAKDDPMIPMAPFERRAGLLAGNPWLTTIFTEAGGHVGFIQSPAAACPEPWMDAYWAENAAIAFLRWIDGGQQAAPALTPDLRPERPA
jgi:predicted alpha/beta-fold hydrolase